jgi:hypothetical protein
VRETRPRTGGEGFFLGRWRFCAGREGLGRGWRVGNEFITAVDAERARHNEKALFGGIFSRFERVPLALIRVMVTIHILAEQIIFTVSQEMRSRSYRDA